MDEHADELKISLSKIEARATDAERLAAEADHRAREADLINARAQQTFDAARDKSEGFIRELDEAKNRVQEALLITQPSSQSFRQPAATSSQNAALSDSQRGALAETEQMLRAKPEASYQFDDWDARGLAAYAAGDLESAAIYFRNAMLTPDATREQASRAGINRGVTLSRLQRPNEALATYDEVIARFQDSNDAGVQGHVSTAMVNKGATLQQLRRSDESLAVFNDLLARYGENSEHEIMDSVALALMNRGVSLTSLKRLDEAVASYEELDRRFSKASAVSIRGSLAGGLANMTYTLMRTGDLPRALNTVDRAIALYEELGSSFDASAVSNWCNKVELLIRMGHSDEAVAMADQVIKRYGETSDLNVLARLVEARFTKAIALGRMDRVSEARSILRKIAEESATSNNKSVIELAQLAGEYAVAPVNDWDFADIYWQNF